MNPTEVHQLLEKCKAATSADKIDRFYKLDDDALRNLTTENIQALAENYLEAIEEMKIIADNDAADGRPFQRARDFLKKVGAND